MSEWLLTSTNSENAARLCGTGFAVLRASRNSQIHVSGKSEAAVDPQWQQAPQSPPALWLLAHRKQRLLLLLLLLWAQRLLVLPLAAQGQCPSLFAHAQGRQALVSMAIPILCFRKALVLCALAHSKRCCFCLHCNECSQCSFGLHKPGRVSTGACNNRNACNTVFRAHLKEFGPD